jgi:predicted Zn finger-like uncharacterized protein
VYTQCPDCATVFRVTAETLRAAQGDVRCGVCATSFNALENLSEQAFRPAPESEASSPDDSMTVEELPGTENIELSGPPEIVAVPDAPAPPADEAEAMEFHGDAADLDRLFVVEEPAIARFEPADAEAPPAAAEPAEAEPAEPEPAADPDSTDEHPILVLDERDDIPEDPPPPVEVIVLESPEAEAAPAEPEAPPLPAAAPAQASSPTTGHTAPRILIPDEMRRRLAAEAAAREEAASAFEPDDDEPRFFDRRWPWVAGTAVLAVLFLLQVVHAQRYDLARSPAFGPIVAGAYSFFGARALAPTDLAAYELRQWGAASDPSAPNRLVLRASVVNHASYAQPMPLLRLALQDRFGGTMGLRDIAPADYLPGSGGSSLLGPGERADALIRIVDPGAEAVGFELDVCLPAGGGVRCAGQLKTASP